MWELSCAVGWASEKLLESTPAAQRQGSVSSVSGCLSPPQAHTGSRGYWLSALAKVNVHLLWFSSVDLFAGRVCLFVCLNCMQLYSLCAIPSWSPSMSPDKVNVSGTSGEEAGVGMRAYSPQAPRAPGGERPGYDICFRPPALLYAPNLAGFLCVPLLSGVVEMVWPAANTMCVYFKSQTTAEALLSIIVVWVRFLRQRLPGAQACPPIHYPLASASTGETGSQTCATTAQLYFFCVYTFLCGYACAQWTYVYVSLVPFSVCEQSIWGLES